MSVLTERLVRSTSVQRSRWLWVALLPLGLVMLVGGPVGLGILLFIVLSIGANRSGHVARLWRSAPVIWLGRGMVVVALGIGGVLLVRDIVAVL